MAVSLQGLALRQALPKLTPQDHQRNLIAIASVINSLWISLASCSIAMGQGVNTKPPQCCEDVRDEALDVVLLPSYLEVVYVLGQHEHKS